MWFPRGHANVSGVLRVDQSLVLTGVISSRNSVELAREKIRSSGVRPQVGCPTWPTVCGHRHRLGQRRGDLGCVLHIRPHGNARGVRGGPVRFPDYRERKSRTSSARNASGPTVGWVPGAVATAGAHNAAVRGDPGGGVGRGPARNARQARRDRPRSPIGSSVSQISEGAAPEPWSGPCPWGSEARFGPASSGGSTPQGPRACAAPT